MKKIIGITLILFLLNIFLQGQPNNGLNLKLGILVFSDESVFSAKTYEKIRSDDGFQIVLQSMKESYIYIINYDDKRAKILYHTSISADELTRFPDSSNYYCFDGQATWEHLSLIIFKNRNLILEKLFHKNDLSYDAWEKQEQTLMDDSIFQFVGKYNFPRIAGNIRGDDNIQLLEFTSDKHFIKKYTFYVKK